MKVELSNYRELDYFRNEAIKALRTNITFCGSDVRVIALIKWFFCSANFKERIKNYEKH